jgi:hypothetical protein
MGNRILDFSKDLKDTSLNRTKKYIPRAKAIESLNVVPQNLFEPILEP